MFPLLRLFSALEVVATDGWEQAYMLGDAILPHEWDRFRMFSEYVQVVDTIFQPRGPHTISSSTWSDIGRLTGSDPLLPNLRELGWVVISPQCTGILHFLSPALAQLSITCFESINNASPVNRQQRQAGFEGILPTVFSVASRLSKLTVATGGQLDTFNPSLSNLRSLRYFCGTRVNIRTLQVLSTLDELEELHVGFFDTTDQPSISFSGFRRLRVLVISHHPSSNVAYEAFDSPRLDTLRVSYYSPKDYHNVAQSCQIWADRFPSLHTLSFYVSPTKDPFIARPLRECIAPLLSIHHLRSVAFSTWWTMFTIDDEDVVAFAQAWPRMQHLSLTPALGGWASKDRDPSACPTPSSILTLAERCPDLKTIHIRYLDIPGPGGLPDLSRQPAVVGHRLESFSVQRADIDDALVPEFARWIDRLFPHLVPEVSNPEESWQRVLDAVKDCQNRRRQEEESLT